MTTTKPPLIMHLLYRLDFGGLESLLVDSVNHMPADQFRHAIVCLTDYTEFSQKITRPDVTLVALHKPPGLAPTIHWALWKLFRQLRPAVLHTYNLAAIEYAFVAKLAGVPVCLHAEHGRDCNDPTGSNVMHNFLRRILSPCIDRYVSVSADLAGWLTRVVHIPESKQQLIMNGIDTDRFDRRDKSNTHWSDQHLVIGTVGQLREIKNQRGLIRAFQLMLQLQPHYRDILRLSIIGAGSLMDGLKQQVDAAGLNDLVWLPGARSDTPDLLSGFSVFVLPSHAEGTPLALLEAMSCALPVVATRVGGIPDVISDQVNGTLVPPDDDLALSMAILGYLNNPELARTHGMAARRRVVQQHSMNWMIENYTQLYRALYHEKCHEKLS